MIFRAKWCCRRGCKISGRLNVVAAVDICLYCVHWLRQQPRWHRPSICQPCSTFQDSEMGPHAFIVGHTPGKTSPLIFCDDVSCDNNRSPQSATSTILQFVADGKILSKRHLTPLHFIRKALDTVSHRTGPELEHAMT